MTQTERIRWTRRKTGLSQARLAKLIGVNRSAVANWETECQGGPCHDNLVRLARIAHVSIEWLATGRGEIKLDPSSSDTATVNSEQMACPNEQRLLHAWRASSPTARIAAIELLEAVAHKRHGGKKPFARPHDGMAAPPPPVNSDFAALANRLRRLRGSAGRVERSVRPGWMLHRA